MWKYVFLVLIYLITLEVWKCGKNLNWDALYRTKVHNLKHGEMQTTIMFFFCTSFLCVFLKVDSAKNFKILSEAHPCAYLVANRISWKPNPQQSHSVQKGRPFSSRTNNYKNMRPGGELKLAMSPSCDWQQSEVTQVISPHTSPIFNSQIIPDTFPDFHTFRVIRLKQTRHISRFPHFQS